MSSLFVRMSSREKKLGWLWFAVSAPAVCFLTGGLWGNLLCQGLSAGAGLLIFRRFLGGSARVPLVRPSQVLLQALLGLILVQLSNLLVNDLVFFFLPEYFFYDTAGPHFQNVHKAALALLLAEHYWPAALGAVVLAPVAEELFYRGLVFGTLHEKAPALAYPVSTVVYALVSTAGLSGRCEGAYLALHFLQYLPIGLFFGWVYSRSQTIFAPLLAHIALNAVGIFAMGI